MLNKYHIKWGKKSKYYFADRVIDAIKEWANDNNITGDVGEFKLTQIPYSQDVKDFIQMAGAEFFCFDLINSDYLDFEDGTFGFSIFEETSHSCKQHLIYISAFDLAKNIFDNASIPYHIKESDLIDFKEWLKDFPHAEKWKQQAHEYMISNLDKCKVIWDYRRE